MLRHTSMPSTSGRPRSRITRSGAASATWLTLPFPLCAVTTSSPRAVSPMRSALSSDGSSSTTRTLVMPASGGCGHVGRGRDGEHDPGAVFDLGVDPDVPTVSLDERSGDRQAEAGAAATAVLAEHLEYPLPILLPDAGPVVGDRDLDPRRRAPRRPAADTRMLLSSGVRRSAFSSTLARTWLMRTWSMWRSGRSAGASTLTRPGADAVQRPERLVHQLVEAIGAARAQRACLDTGHVEQVGDEPGQTVRLRLDQFEKLGPVAAVEAARGLAQARDGRLDGRQRRAQVMRRRAHQRAAPRSTSSSRRARKACFAELRPVHRQRGLVGEGAEQAPVPFGQSHLMQDEHPHGSVVDDEQTRPSET